MVLGEAWCPQVLVVCTGLSWIGFGGLLGRRLSAGHGQEGRKEAVVW